MGDTGKCKHQGIKDLGWGAGGARARAAASPGSDGKRIPKLLSARKQVDDRPAKIQPPEPMHLER